MIEIDLGIRYTKAQETMFEDLLPKCEVLVNPKGRQAGGTHGLMLFAIEKMIDGEGPILWGDVTDGNCNKYVNEFAVPVLEQLGPQGRLWNYNQSKSVLRVFNQKMHFRNKQNPFNWEGFAYKYIIVNEAGIVLKNRYIYENAIIPMTWRHGGKVIVSGVPKGNKGVFKELADRGNDPNDKDHITFRMTGYDNPFINPDHLDKYALGMANEAVVKQELHGQFVAEDDDDWQVIKRKWVDAAMQRWRDRVAAGFQPELYLPEKFANDPSMGGKDSTTFAWLIDGNFVDKLDKVPGKNIEDGATIRDLMLGKLNARLMTVEDNRTVRMMMAEMRSKLAVIIDSVGIGRDVLRAFRGEKNKRLFRKVHAMIGGRKSKWKPPGTKYKVRNARTAWAFNLRELLMDPKSELCLPPDEQLAEQLCAFRYSIGENDTISLEKKDLTKARLNNQSPDDADVVMMLLAPFTGTGTLEVG